MGTGMQVRAADARAIHPDQDIVNADLRHGNLFEPQTRLRLFFD